MRIRHYRLESPGLLIRVMFFGLILGGGIWLRQLSETGVSLNLGQWLPWTQKKTVNLYFLDSSGQFFVPVSRQMPNNADLPRDVLDALLAGPGKDTGLTNPLQPDTTIRSFILDNGIARINFSSDIAGQQIEKAKAVIVETLTALPGVKAVRFSINSKALRKPVKRLPLLYFASAKGLVAVPSDADTPRAALAAYLDGEPITDLTGLPSDVELLAYEFNPDNGLLSVNFSYTASLRSLAIEHPDIMRRVLTGLIASLTEYPEIQAVQLNFDGHVQLGLGQCSDLLRAPQLRPEILNDELLLGR